MDTLKRWSFDADVAESFVDHARAHIPGYERIVDFSVQVARECCKHGDRIAEIGCATGFTLQRLEAAGFDNIVGVDSSAAMLEGCNARRAELVLSERFPSERAPFKLVLANWTLHFVPPEQRSAYLGAVREGLATGGKLVLSDKTAQSPFIERHYHDFKRGRGVSDAEIREKKRRLVGVLEPLPVQWYVDTLCKLGFAIEIPYAQHGFVTFLASL